MSAVRSMARRVVSLVCSCPFFSGEEAYSLHACSLHACLAGLQKRCDALPKSIWILIMIKLELSVRVCY